MPADTDDTGNADASPQGIDAKKRPIMILHKLAAIEKRLTQLEQRIP